MSLCDTRRAIFEYYIIIQRRYKMRTYTIFDLMDVCAKVDRRETSEEVLKRYQQNTSALFDAFNLEFSKECGDMYNSKHEFIDAMYDTYRIIKNSNDFTENPFSGMLEAPEYISKMYHEYRKHVKDKEIRSDYKITDPQKKQLAESEMKLTVFRFFFGDVTKTVTLEEDFLSEE
jgi:hypothetical protein